MQYFLSACAAHRGATLAEDNGKGREVGFLGWKMVDCSQILIWEIAKNLSASMDRHFQPLYESLV